MFDLVGRSIAPNTPEMIGVRDIGERVLIFSGIDNRGQYAGAVWRQKCRRARLPKSTKDQYATSLLFQLQHLLVNVIAFFATQLTDDIDSLAAGQLLHQFCEQLVGPDHRLIA